MDSPSKLPKNDASGVSIRTQFDPGAMAFARSFWCCFWGYFVRTPGGILGRTRGKLVSGWQKKGDLGKILEHSNCKIVITIWLVVWLPFLAFSHILGISSSQLTNIFQRGSNHQPAMTCYFSHMVYNLLSLCGFSVQMIVKGHVHTQTTVGCVPWSCELRKQNMHSGAVSCL